MIRTVAAVLAAAMTVLLCIQDIPPIKEEVGQAAKGEKIEAFLYTTPVPRDRSNTPSPQKLAALEKDILSPNEDIPAKLEPVKNDRIAVSDEENDIPEKLEPVENDQPVVSDEEVELLAMLVMAEAEGECEEGRRLVIDSVLNRVDNCHFPGNIRDVIFQPYHYSPVWDGRLYAFVPDEDNIRLVREELEDRLNSEVIFFRTQRYSDYGTPMFQIQHHYFSSY